jgi:hypothetical protein
MLVERQKANALRLHNLNRYRSAKRAMSKIYTLKNKNLAKQLKKAQESHEAYRRIADLMNDQRPVLRELRKVAGAIPKYNGANFCNCVWLHTDGVAKRMTWEEVTIAHTSYVFEATVLKESKLENPYAKELYGKETKQEENNTLN